MKKCLLYLLRNAAQTLAVLAAAIAIIVGGRLLTHESGALFEIFSLYLRSIPVLLAVFLYIYSAALTTSLFHVALSMGARRRDYFAALQVLFLIMIGVCWLLQLGADQIALHLGWEDLNAWDFAPVSRNPAVPAVFLLALTLGCLINLSMSRQRMIGVLLVLGGCILVSVLLFLSMAVYSSHLWGDLPWILPLASFIGALGCELGLYRSIRKAVVL